MNRRILAPTVMLCGMLLFTGCASAGDSSAATKPDTSGSNAAAPEAEASVPADGAFETMTLKAAHVFQESHPIHKGMELFAQRVNHDHPSNGWFARPYKGTVTGQRLKTLAFTLFKPLCP